MKGLAVTNPQRITTGLFPLNVKKFFKCLSAHCFGLQLYSFDSVPQLLLVLFTAAGMCFKNMTHCALHVLQSADRQSLRLAGEHSGAFSR